MVVVCRTSFGVETSPAGESPPRKKRKTTVESSHRGDDTGKFRTTTCSDAYRVISPLGFGPSDFLPLDHASKTKKCNRNKICEDLDLVDTLSDDVLGRCFFSGFLDTFDTARLMMVNKRIRRAGFQKVHLLDLRRCENLTSSHVSYIASSFSNLTELDFSYCSHFGGRCLEQLIPCSKNLRQLLLRGTRVHDMALVYYLQEVHRKFGGCSLETLDLSAVNKENSFLIGDEAARSISSYCPRLKSLQLGWCKKLTDEGVKSLASLENLTTLDLSLTSITYAAFYDLLQIVGSGLEVMDVSATGIFPPPQLLQLDGNLERTKDLISGSNMQKLSALRLQFCPQLTTALLEHIVQSATSLKHVDVTHSGQGRLVIGREFAKYLRHRRIQVEGAHRLAPLNFFT
eukprot:scaffold918_cov126-Cylindrotheca_fusiformis.AAC.56